MFFEKRCVLKYCGMYILSKKLLDLEFCSNVRYDLYLIKLQCRNQLYCIRLCEINIIWVLNVYVILQIM